jgi:hypothetical protein
VAEGGEDVGDLRLAVKQLICCALGQRKGISRGARSRETRGGQ